MTTLGVFRDDFYPQFTALPSYQYSSTSQASGVIPVANIAGAAECYMTQSGATALSTPTAAAMYAQLIQSLVLAGVSPNSLNGTTYFVRIINTNGGTLTLTGGTGVTFLGTATLATNTSRDFIVTVTSPVTVTFQSVGTGTTS